MRIYIVILFTCLSGTTFCQDLFTPVWAKEAHVNAGFERLCGLVTDTEGNVYFAGYAQDTMFIDTLAIDPSNHGMYSFICKYNTHGDLQWMSKYSCSEGYSGVRLRSIHLNNNDELVAIGSTSNKTTYNAEYINDGAFERGFIHVVDDNGDTKNYAEFDSLYFWSVTIDINNNISAIAEPFGTSTTILDTTINANYTLFQLSDSLTLNWIQSHPVPHPNSNLYWQTNAGLEFIASDSDGQLFASYNYSDTLNLHDETYLPHNYYTVTIDSIEISEDSFFVEIDSFFNMACDAVLIKYDSQGNKIWDFVIEGLEWQSISGITADDQGGCYILLFVSI